MSGGWNLNGVGYSGTMPRALKRTRGRIALLAFLALAAFVVGATLPHHASAGAATPAGASTVSTSGHDVLATAHSGAAGSAPSASDAMADADQSQDDHGEHPCPTPVCHATNVQAKDVVNRSALQGDALGLLGALFVAVTGAERVGAWTGVQRWVTRPPCPLAGFLLLITLGVSRT